MKLQNLLVPVDGSQNAFDALDVALLIAEKTGSSVTLLHVIPGGPLPEALKQYARSEHLDPTPWLYEKQVAERILEAGAARGSDTALDISQRTDNGDPAARILAVAEDLGCDAIVMGHRGTGELESLMMGSVARKVNHKARCSVITVKD